MPFTPKDWQDTPSTVSPITATALEDLETRVTDYAEAQTTFYSFKQFSNLTFDGTTNVAPAINAALVDINAAGGGVLVLPPGVGYLGESIILRDLTGIQGQGMYATHLSLANAVNDSVIKNYVSSNGTEANAEFCMVMNLTIEANKANQTSGHGIYFNTNPADTQASGDIAFDPLHLVRDVKIIGAKNNGFYQQGRSETRLINVTATECDGIGFVPSYDSFLIGCTAAHSGLSGFKIASSACRLTNCKSFYSGNLTGSAGYGFHITTQGGAMLAACEAQDNKAHGFFLESTTRGSVLAACLADSNSTTSAGTYTGFSLSGSSYNRIQGVAYERRANGATNYQSNGLLISSSSTRNEISLSHYAATGATVTDAIKSTSDSVAGNNITINNENGYQAGTYAATYTPDPYAGSTIKMTLTGNITINPPAAANCHIGSKLRFILTQDGTGSRLGTWDSAYKKAGGSLTLTTTAAKTDVIDWEYDGTSWFETNRSLNL